jgi:SAM-dependent methyltransferase
VSERMLERVRAHYGDRIRVARVDALAMPYADASKDVLIIFEAIYYLPDLERFFQECRRVLKPGGHLLIATANKDLEDFNPSPHSHVYPGVLELRELGKSNGFSVRCFGYLDTKAVSLRQRVLSPIKRIVVSLGLMPKTMRGKQLLKRLVFGRLVTMPAELDASSIEYEAPTELSLDGEDRRHKVIYCAATVENAVSRQS